MIEIKPATRETLERFYGKQPDATVCAWVAEQDGVLLGCGGIAFRGPALEVFSDFGDELKRHPKYILKAARIILKKAAEYRRPVFALRNKDEPTADAFLRRLGFEPKGDLYKWHSSP